MKPESIDLHAWWGPRRESVTACAEKAALWLDRLGRAEPDLRSWKWADEKELTLSVPALRDVLLAGRTWKESIAEIMTEPGFSLVAHARHANDADAIELSMRIGGFSTVMRNVVNMHIPATGPSSGVGFTRCMLTISKAVIEIWEPEGLVVAETAQRNHMREFKYGTYLGGMTYMPGVASAEVQKALPREFIAEDVAKGCLVVLDVPRLSWNDPEQRVAIAAAQQLLIQGGMLSTPRRSRG